MYLQVKYGSIHIMMSVDCLSLYDSTSKRYAGYELSPEIK